MDLRAHVVAGSRRSSPTLADLAADGRVTFVPVDLATADGPVALVAADALRGGVDILVNNAGAATPHPGGFITTV